MLLLLLYDLVGLPVDLWHVLELLLFAGEVVLDPLLVLLLLDELVLLLVLQELLQVPALLLRVGLRLEGALLQLSLLLQLLQDFSLLLLVLQALLVALVEILKREELLLVGYFLQLVLSDEQVLLLPCLLVHLLHQFQVSPLEVLIALRVVWLGVELLLMQSEAGRILRLGCCCAAFD